MLSLLSIYWLSIAASAVLAAGLALLGAQLAARDRAMQTMCVGQGAMLGVLLGIGLSQILHVPPNGEATIPFVLAFASAALAFWSSERLVVKRAASSNTHFAALFSALLASGHLVSALFPALENHMAQKYFGDLATVSEGAAGVVLALGVGLLSMLVFLGRAITRDSFAATILGMRKSRTTILFAGGTLAALCSSVQVVGFMFTMACLFIPTSILSLGRQIGLRRHLVACSLVGATSSFGGFIASLWFTRLPTVPTIIAVMAVSAVLVNKLSSVSYHEAKE